MCVSLEMQQLGTHRLENLRQPRQIRQVEDDPGGDTEGLLEGIQVVKQTGVKLSPLKISLQVDECEIPMEIDIGASMSIISEDTYMKFDLRTRKLAENQMLSYRAIPKNPYQWWVHGNGQTLLGKN